MIKRITFFVFLLVSFVTLSGEGAWSSRKLFSEIAAGQDYSIYSPFSMYQDSKDYSSYEGLVFLEYTRKNQSDLSSYADWHITVGISFVNALYITEYRDLTISYEQGAYVYSDYEVIETLNSGYSIHIEDIEAEYYNGTVWGVASAAELPIDIDFRLELREESIYKLDVDVSNFEVPNLEFDPLTYRVSWSYIQGEEEYDLEWVFIDRLSNEYDEMTAVLNDAALFSNGGYKLAFELKESAGVRVRGTHFQLDKTYTTGRLFFRVRPVSVFADAQSVTDDIKLGEWTYFNNSSYMNGGTISAANLTYHQIEYDTDFESTQNWLYGVAFAENGKNVSSVSFYDGSNRGRQSLTYNTSDDITLIGESKYDYEGRQVISVVPAPIEGRALGYRANFNLLATDQTLNSDGTLFDDAAYDIEDYIGVTSPQLAIKTTNDPILGAGQYFSGENKFEDDLFTDNIPDANGYAYSQTVYRNDGSGRIERVGGIGEEFQVGGDHAIETFYGSPTSTELKRLFGNNVSDNLEGYRKEMVKDANGQYSVTYYDKRGNVIATGLSGNAPTNLIELDGAIVETIQTPLNDNNNLIDPYTMQSKHTFMNGIIDNPITLDYNVSGDVNTIITQSSDVLGVDLPITNGTLCSTCRYDLTVVVKDDKGQHVGSSPYTYDVGPTGTFEDCITSPGTFTMPTISLVFPNIGEYTIVKTLTLDLENMQAAFNDEIATAGLTNSSTFVSNYLEIVDLSGCYNTCDDYCVASWKLDQIHNNPAISTKAEADALWGISGSMSDPYIVACLDRECDLDSELADLDLAMEPQDGTGSNCELCQSLAVAMGKQLELGGEFYDEVIGDPANANIVMNGEVLSDYYNGTYEWTPEMALMMVTYHREYCHLETCNDWAASLSYSMKLAIKMNATGWVPSNALYTAPYNTDVTILQPSVSVVSEDPFMNSSSVFNTITPSLADRVGSYLTDNQVTSGQTGNLIDYTNAFITWLTAQGGTTGMSAAEIDEYRILIYTGMYDKIKEDIVAEYNASINPECEFFLEDPDFAIFKGNQTEVNQAILVDQLLDVLENSQLSCEDQAYQNTLNWLSFISEDCQIELGLLQLNLFSSNPGDPIEVVYTNSFTHNSLNTTYLGGTASTLAELLYAFSMETCSTNTFGYFYDPSNGGIIANAPGQTEYDAIMVILNDLEINGDCDFDLQVFFETCTPEAGGSLDYTFNSTYSPYINLVSVAQSQAAIQYLFDLGFAYNVAGNYSYTQNETIGYSEVYETNLSNQNLGNGLVGDIYIRMKRFMLLGVPTGVWEMTDLTWEVRNAGSSNGGTQSECVYSGEMDPIIGAVFSSFRIVGASLSQSTWIGNAINTLPLLDFELSYTDNLGVSFPGDADLQTNCVVIPNTSTSFDFNHALPSLAWPCFEEYDYIEDCIQAENNEAEVDATTYFDGYLLDLQNQFLLSTIECMDAVEDFTMTYKLKEYQYTLYYYDLAGNLVQTVPPKGVDILNSAETNNGDDPIHRMETRYQYNGLNTLIAQYTPDGGHSDFVLDELYRVRYSQNARQEEEEKASYTKYDELGRVTEAGELLLGSTNNTIAYLESNVEDNSFPVIGADKVLDYTQTFYEEGYTPDPTIANSFENGEQSNLRNTIGAIFHRQADYETDGSIIGGSEVRSVISYSYDPHKNVQELVSTNYQLAIIGHQNKKVGYEYDLISGNVNEVVYQEGFEDEYRHKYHYDANNRLVRAFTSRDGGTSWEKEAKYFYYLHGALARVELGEDEVQGTDYAYNLQGWLKGVNSSTLKSYRDMGRDGGNGDNTYFGADSYGYNLGYYEGDYTSIKPTTAFADLTHLRDVNLNSSNEMGSLYNGNIPNMVTAMMNHNEGAIEILGNNYQYDQLQRIKSMDVYQTDNLRGSNSFNGAGVFNNGAYKTRYSFDANGNLATLSRNGSGKDEFGSSIALAMDDFTYSYNDGVTSVNVLEPNESNQLASVIDQETNIDYGVDVQPGQLEQTDNYQYDASGQLIKDVQEGIDEIIWSVTGKVKEIHFGSGKNDLKFIYDAMDMRIAKVEYYNTIGLGLPYIETTYYTYDAQGNVMATYKRTHTTFNIVPPQVEFTETFELQENMIYGSSRLGVDNRNMLLTTANVVTDINDLKDISLEGHGTSWSNIVDYDHDQTHRIVDLKFYELSNHLGNVLNVITDRKSSNISQSPLDCEFVDHWSLGDATVYVGDDNSDGITDLKVTGSAANASIINTMNTVVGETYTVSFSINDIGAGTGNITAEVEDCASVFNNSLVVSTVNDHSFTFIATSVKTVISWEMQNAGEFVLSEISVIGNGTPSENVIASVGYLPDVVSFSDYYPYGSLLDGRHGQAESKYRYGFQGQEMDDEVKGEGNSVNYKYRMHDPRIGRFFAIDPLHRRFPWYSPYQFSGNQVLNSIELEGLEPQEIIIHRMDLNRPLISVSSSEEIHHEVPIKLVQEISNETMDLADVEFYACGLAQEVYSDLMMNDVPYEGSSKARLTLTPTKAYDELGFGQSRVYVEWGYTYTYYDADGVGYTIHGTVIHDYTSATDESGTNLGTPVVYTPQTAGESWDDSAKKNLKSFEWKKTSTWGHSFRTHGAGEKITNKLRDRARKKGDQGQWLDNKKSANWLKSNAGKSKNNPLKNGKGGVIDIPDGTGQVIKKDGSIVKTNKAVVIWKPDGSIKTSYPVTEGWVKENTAP